MIVNWLRSGDKDALTPYLQDGFRVVQAHGWYLSKPLSGYPSTTTKVPGTPFEYCVKGPTPCTHIIEALN